MSMYHIGLLLSLKRRLSSQHASAGRLSQPEMKVIKRAQIKTHAYSQVRLMWMIHTTFLLHGWHDTAKERRLGVNMVNMVAPAGCKGFPAPRPCHPQSRNPHTPRVPGTSRTGWRIPSSRWLAVAGWECTAWFSVRLATLGVTWGHLHHIAYVFASSSFIK